MEVEIGKEGLKFENGAFTYYGVSALTLPSSGEMIDCGQFSLELLLEVGAAHRLEQWDAVFHI